MLTQKEQKILDESLVPATQKKGKAFPKLYLANLAHIDNFQASG